MVIFSIFWGAYYLTTYTYVPTHNVRNVRFISDIHVHFLSRVISLTVLPSLGVATLCSKNRVLCFSASPGIVLVIMPGERDDSHPLLFFGMNRNEQD